MADAEPRFLTAKTPAELPWSPANVQKERVAALRAYRQFHVLVGIEHGVVPNLEEGACAIRIYPGPLPEREREIPVRLPWTHALLPGGAGDASAPEPEIQAARTARGTRWYCYEGDFPSLYDLLVAAAAGRTEASFSYVAPDGAGGLKVTRTLSGPHPGSMELPTTPLDPNDAWALLCIYLTVLADAPEGAYDPYAVEPGWHSRHNMDDSARLALISWHGITATGYEGTPQEQYAGLAAYRRLVAEALKKGAERLVANAARHAGNAAGKSKSRARAAAAIWECLLPGGPAPGI
jgi:hypothetical protein